MVWRSDPSYDVPNPRNPDPRPAAAGFPAGLLRLADERAWFAGVLLVAAHPDDETIGAGGVLRRLPIVGVAHATDGAPADRRWWGDPSLASREVYAGVRRTELTCALALAGVSARRMRSLGREDQRASFDLAALTREIARLIDEIRPGVVLTHTYEGGHPDHDATAFAVHAALAPRGGGEVPAIVEFTGYHASGDGIATGAFLPAETEEVDVPLSAGDREVKRGRRGR